MGVIVMPNKNKKKKKLKKWIEYKFDNYISKGVRAQFVLLLIVIFVIVIVFGVIASIVSSQFDIGNAIWQSLMHIIDQGTICGDELSDVWYIIVMLIVTFLGMAFTGTIVGIINNAMSEKLDSLKKGHSQIIEEGHVVVIGFDDNIHTILSELEESNQNYVGNKTIVVVDGKDKEEMEFIVKEHQRSLQQTEENYELKKSKKTRTKIIYRSGNIVSENTYVMISLEKARSIIINKENDFDVVKVMLALRYYLERHHSYIMNDKMPSIVSLMHENENVSAAAIAAGVYHESDTENVIEAEKKVRVLYFENILAQIFAQVCRQAGLSWVISEILDYANSEIYIEDKLKNGKKIEDIFQGKTFGEISAALTNSIAIGIQRKIKVRKGDEIIQKDIILNPDPYSTIFEKGDKLIHLAEEDNEIVVDFKNVVNCIGVASQEKEQKMQPYHFLILGWSVALNDIVMGIKKYAEEGSTIKIISRKEDEEQPESVKLCQNNAYQEHDEKENGETNIFVELEAIDPYNWTEVKSYLEKQFDDSNNSEKPTNIVIMCQDGIDKVEADEKVAVLLLNIREFLKKRGLYHSVNITTEMNLPEDQILLSNTTANDFIVGSELANRMMVQVVNNPYIFSVFRELLSEEGSKIYLRKFSEYVDVNEPFNFEFIRQIATNRVRFGKDMQEIALGWIKLGDDGVKPIVRLNPKKANREEIFKLQDENDSFDNYRLVILAID